MLNCTSLAGTQGQLDLKPKQSLSGDWMTVMKKGQQKWYGNHLTGTYENTLLLLGELPDAGHAVALEADKNGLRRRLAIDPVFDFIALRIAFANLVFRLTERGDNFFAIHADGGTTILDGLP